MKEPDNKLKDSSGVTCASMKTIDEIVADAVKCDAKIPENRVVIIPLDEEPVFGITVKFTNRPGVVVRAEDGKLYTTKYWVPVDKSAFLLCCLTEREMRAVADKFLERREPWFSVRMRKNNMDDIQYPYVVALICDTDRLRELDTLVAEMSLGMVDMYAGKKYVNEFLEMDLIK